MPASRRPRKAYRPRLINAPVTAGLVADFAAVLRRAELGLHLRAPTVEHFDDVARVLNVVGPVVIRRFGATHEVSVAVKSAALHMNAAADRARAGGQKRALVAAFLAKHYGGNETPGTSMHAPMDTITTQDHHALVTASTVGDHRDDVHALLLKYYGSDQDPRLEEPLRTVTTRDRFGLVTVHGDRHEIADIGMRMLQPRELYRAQGFPDDYVIEFEHEGRPLSKAAQVRMCGNSVCPPVAEALVRANFAHERA